MGTWGSFCSYKEKRRYDYILSVVHTFRGLLAPGFARTSALSVDLVTPVAFPDYRHCRGWSAGFGKSNHLSSCPGASRKGLVAV